VSPVLLELAEWSKKLVFLRADIRRHALIGDAALPQRDSPSSPTTLR
jgi:hypothetical protein